ncbi:MAG: ATP-binding protein [Pseudomonadota bacterium]
MVTGVETSTPPVDDAADIATQGVDGARNPLQRWRKRLGNGLARMMPKGLYARAILIIVTPMVLLQSVLVFVFMERHFELVTQRLSAAVTRDIAALISVYEADPTPATSERLRRIAFEDLGLNVAFLPAEPLPPPGQKPFFSIVDRSLSREITRRIGLPFWIDTVGRSNVVEIRIKLPEAVMRVYARRSQTYASNSHIFLVWMVGTSLVLLVVAILFLRNQIRPILQLADAAESFGKGQPVPPDFRPRGAREVRRASRAFIDMRRRIERQIEQRTTMLAGVSHDLRTILTRLRLELALMGDAEEIGDMRRDVEEMQRMLEDYMAFAKGDDGEQSARVDIVEMMHELQADLKRLGHQTVLNFQGDAFAEVRPNAFKRAVANLVHNAHRFGNRVELSGEHTESHLVIHVEDDGPGIPPDRREDVFRPFLRLDDARNQDESGTGLGLSIAMDIVRAHGGNIRLGESDLGGLKSTISVPL